MAEVRGRRSTATTGTPASRSGSSDDLVVDATAMMTPAMRSAMATSM